MEDERDDVWIEIGRFGARLEIDQYGLVLTAAGIDFRLIREENRIGIGMFVRAVDVAVARREITAYARENRRPYPQVPPDEPVRNGLPGALIYAAVLVAVHGLARRGAFSLDWFSAGVSQVGLIADGQWWRVITALGLHADVGHLIANLAVGGLFGVFLAQSLGVGVAWLAILLAGGIGNALNTLVQANTHTSLGASTAVFAAIGILAVLMLKRQSSPWKKGLRRWLPLATGVTLLGFMGFSGVRTDVGAHIGGFVIGCLIGAGFLLAGSRVPKGKTAQIVSGGLALALFGGAWLWAFAATSG